MISKSSRSVGSVRLGVSIAISFGLSVLFLCYVYTEKQIDRANEQRLFSFQLADQMRQSSDDLTRMARTYVATGERRYKQYYQDILDIRNGKKPRPVGYMDIYWDLVLANKLIPNDESGEKVPLLELMRQSGFTEEELNKLVGSKGSSDELAKMELAAMRLVDQDNPDKTSNREKAIKMLNDESYHEAKAKIMEPINDAYQLMAKRTKSSVLLAENIAVFFRMLFAIATLGAIYMLWRTYGMLRSTLGGPVEEVYANIRKIGLGDLSSPISIPQGMENSVLAGLSDMQIKLRTYEMERKQIELSLRSSEELLRRVSDNAEVGLTRLNRDLIYLSANPAYAALAGKSVEQIVGHSMTEVLGEKGMENVRPYVERVLRGEHVNYEAPVSFSASGQRYLHVSYTPDIDASGQVVGWIACIGDISIRKQSEEKLRIAAKAFETHEAIMITDANANIIQVNSAFHTITGYSAEEVVGKNPRILSSGRHDKEFYAALWHELLTSGTWSGEIWDRHKSGSVYPKAMTITAVRDDQGEIAQYVSIFNDISERKQAEEQIHNLAFHDALTALPNRRLLLDRLGVALAASVSRQRYGAVLFLDLDNFKTINDTLGHEAGDQLLIEVSKRIKYCLRETDTVARMGGDEFVVLVEGISSNVAEATQNIAHVSDKIRDVLATPYKIMGITCHSSPSVGVYIFYGNSATVDEVIKRADLAMYQAKDSGKNRVRFYDPEIQKSVEARASLEADLREAIPNQELQLHYQIQVDKGRRPIGAEALIRWIHPKRGMVSPTKFIPVAEESTLMLDIGNWVLETACKQLVDWSRLEQTRHLVLAVNISALHFNQPGFVEQVKACISRYGINGSRLKLELTESVALDDLDHIIAKMSALREALGVSLSLDDFGTGYSSLSCLKRLPLDQVKIDQSFVRDIAKDSNDAVMVKTIIDMAQNFSLNVIAEGVETEMQFSMLDEIGCQAYQGYLFSKPVPHEEFETLLQGL